MPLLPLEFRGAHWDFSRPLIMGVLNLTPDSFSDGGRYATEAEALAHAESMIEDGADCLDLGGESTRPGARAVPAEEEAGRILPVVEALAKRFSVPISVDTCKAAVARWAVEAGAEIVNDVSGGLFDEEMFATIASLKVAYICGHVRGQSLAQVHGSTCESATEVADELQLRLDKMTQAMRSRVIVDPCLGFGKSLPCNIGLMHGGRALSDRLHSPVLIGASRKRFLGEITGRPVDQRDAATAGASLAAIAGGAHMVRVHDVGMTHAALQVFCARPQPGTAA